MLICLNKEAKREYTLYMATTIVIVFVALVILVSVLKTVQIVPQAQNRVVERLGRYHATLQPGLRWVIPYIDRVLPPISLKEQVLNFAPVQGITY